MSITSITGQKKIALAVIGTLMIVLLLARVGLAHARQHTATLRYVAYVSSNPSSDACSDVTGLDAGLQVQLQQRPQTAAEYKKLAQANTPRSTSIEVGKKMYRLDLDTKASAYGNDQIGWNFRHVRMSNVDAASVIGKRAVLRYKIGSRTITTPPTVVTDGRCKSLI